MRGQYLRLSGHALHRCHSGRRCQWMACSHSAPWHCQCGVAFEGRHPRTLPPDEVTRAHNAHKAEVAASQ